MGATTGIEWTDHTWSPWWGCDKVSPGCKHCYAEGIADRFAPGAWGPHGVRKMQSESYWRQPLRWDRAAAKAGVRAKVFPSMCDVFEARSELIAPRLGFFDLIRATEHLDWLLLSKRPENFARMLPWLHGPWSGDPWSNVWLGVSVEDQRRANERLGPLRATPAARRFISYEPALEGVVFDLRGIDWLIAGGESGAGARPCDPAWLRSARDQCAGTGVAFLLKQLGGHPSKRGHDQAVLDGRRHVEFPR